ncbi:MAG: hypothetical protein ACJ8AO_20585 [Gemmatimonadaceae bacterium]|jgi:hypothetical protein
MFGLIALGATVAVALIGYFQSRRFVRERLRFVDAVVQGRWAPFAAAAGAALIAWPVVALLPLVGTGTALLFGASVGIGVAHGSRDARGGGGSWEVVSTKKS